MHLTRASKLAFDLADRKYERTGYVALNIVLTNYHQWGFYACSTSYAYLGDNRNDVTWMNWSTPEQCMRRPDSPTAVSGRSMSINGPRHFSLSLRTATTTVSTAAGTYGGTGGREQRHKLTELPRPTCV